MFNIKYGAIGFFINILYYFIPFSIYYLFNKFVKKSLFIFIPIFILFELLIDSVNFSFPWLILGNCLANSIYTPQIYEFTGSIGGSLIILLITYVVFKNKSKTYKLLIILFPFCFLYLYGYYITTYSLKNKPSKKYIKCLFFDPDESAEKYYNNHETAYYLMKKLSNNNTFDKILVPELTFKSISFKSYQKSIIHDYMKEICKNNNSEIYFGASGTIQRKKLSNIFVYINNNEFYRKAKEKLVPYSEFTPEFLRKILNRNISFDYINDTKWTPLKNKNKELPLICYEAMYSSYVSKNISNIDLMILLTSEKFFNNSYYGKKQYNNIIKLRTIENRKPLLKSSNAGTNLYLDRFGIIKKTCKGEFCTFSIDETTIKSHPNTFYSSYIVKYSLYLALSILVIIILILKKWKKLQYYSYLFPFRLNYIHKTLN